MHPASDEVDPESLLCTFTPATDNTDIFRVDYDPEFDPDGSRYSGFAVVSSAWFRRAPAKLWGQELAAAPDRYPPFGPVLWAEFSDEVGGTFEMEEGKIRWEGWMQSTRPDSGKSHDRSLTPVDSVPDHQARHSGRQRRDP